MNITNLHDVAVLPHSLHGPTDHASLTHLINEAAHHLYFSKLKAHVLYPRFDVRETEDAFELFGELPGCRMEDLTIQNLEGYGLEIKGEIAASYTELESRERGKAEGEGDGGAVVQNGTAKTKDNPASISTSTAPAVQPASLDGAPLHRFDTDTSSTRQTPPSTLPPSSVSHPLYPRMIIHERTTGCFSRHVRFPVPIDTSKVKAELRDGILSIRVAKDLPRIEELEKERKRIEVSWATGPLYGF